ncbi:hypothetical protein AAFF_G00053470 [Aldrovandia affinis]|uniref:Uncharacterized protein n=1 Tax=Aldrovandia affinis TaxID=143900 RepID=A0AAD7WEM9_9TELE|nr:hypothetical protein AAFF_G00053470 [Aldrovandia affinis]
MGAGGGPRRAAAGGHCRARLTRGVRSEAGQVKATSLCHRRRARPRPTGGHLFPLGHCGSPPHSTPPPSLIFSSQSRYGLWLMGSLILRKSLRVPGYVLLALYSHDYCSGVFPSLLVGNMLFLIESAVLYWICDPLADWSQVTQGARGWRMSQPIGRGGTDAESGPLSHRQRATD